MLYVHVCVQLYLDALACVFVLPLTYLIITYS